MKQLIRPLLTLSLLFMASRVAAQEILAGSFTRSFGCCSDHNRVSTVPQIDRRLSHTNAWKEGSCLCDGMNSSGEREAGTISLISDLSSPRSIPRVRNFHGLLVGELDYITELIGEAGDFGDPSSFGLQLNVPSRYVFKVRHSRRRLKVSILRPFEVQLDQILYRSWSAFTVQGVKLITNQVVGEECQETVKVKVESINRVRPSVTVARSIDCLSARFRNRWSGELRKR